MSDVVQDFLAVCWSQETKGERVPPEYVFARDLVRGVRTFVVNLNRNEEEEAFIADLFTAKLRSPDVATITIEQPYVQHLKEFLQGAK